MNTITFTEMSGQQWAVFICLPDGLEFYLGFMTSTGVFLPENYSCLTPELLLHLTLFADLLTENNE